MGMRKKNKSVGESVTWEMRVRSNNLNVLDLRWRWGEGVYADSQWRGRRVFIWLCPGLKAELSWQLGFTDLPSFGGGQTLAGHCRNQVWGIHCGDWQSKWSPDTVLLRESLFLKRLQERAEELTFPQALHRFSDLQKQRRREFFNARSLWKSPERVCVGGLRDSTQEMYSCSW